MDPIAAILDAREVRPWYSYKLSEGAFALDLARPEPAKLDRGKMSASAVFSTNARDRQGDILEPSGIRTENHRFNPIALLDHGKKWNFPLGLTEDRSTGLYLVSIDPSSGEATQTTHFNPHCPVAEQTYRAIDDGFLRGNSIGFRSLKAVPMGEVQEGQKPPLHLIEVELLEITWTALPVNPEALRTVLSRGRIGAKSIMPELRQAFEPYAMAVNTSAVKPAARAKLPAHGVTGQPVTTAAHGEKAMEPAMTGAAEGLDPNTDNLTAPPKQGDANADPYTKKSMDEVEPHSAGMVRGFHKHILGAMRHHKSNDRLLENDSIREAFGKILPLLEQAVEHLEEAFSAEHPDLEPLEDVDDPNEGDPEGSDGMEAMAGKAAEEELEGGGEKNTDMGAMYAASLTGEHEGKGMQKGHKSMISAAADWLASHSDVMQKCMGKIPDWKTHHGAARYHAKMLKELCADPAPHDVKPQEKAITPPEDALSDDDAAMLIDALDDLGTAMGQLKESNEARRKEQRLIKRSLVRAGVSL